MYDYKQKGTHLSGFLNYLQKNYPHITIQTYGDINQHLKAIRLRKEPNKPVSTSAEKNATYIQVNYNWGKDVINYFKQL